jgi:hypothetical protein
MHQSRLPIVLCGALVVLSSFMGILPAQASSSHVTSTPPTVEQLIVPPGAVDAQLNAVSCRAVGSCVAGGTSSPDTKNSRAIISSEVHGVWGPLKVVGPKTDENSIVGLACPAPGSCVAIGDHTAAATVAGNSQESGFMITQQGSAWSPPQIIPLSGMGPHPSIDIFDIQCPSTTFCVIIGRAAQLVALTWNSGKWSAPHDFFLSDFGKKVRDAYLPSLSCTSINWCIAVGQEINVASNSPQAVSVTMKNGQWGRPTPLVGYHDSKDGNFLASVWCVAKGSCFATGGTLFDLTNPVPLVMTESHGHWKKAKILTTGLAPPPDSSMALSTVSCASDTQCTGLITTYPTTLTSGAATTRGAGHWSVHLFTQLGAFVVPSLTALTCMKGTCVAVGNAKMPSDGNGTFVPLVVTSHGAW